MGSLFERFRSSRQHLPRLLIQLQYNSNLKEYEPSTSGFFGWVFLGILSCILGDALRFFFIYTTLLIKIYIYIYNLELQR
jgi:hypothetical protein